MSRTVAIIGSFRRFYREILAIRAAFLAAGWVVTTPAGGEILDPHVEFVLFDTDPHDADPALIETVALHRILRADAVYVCCPEGYVGRTTCYEIGRIIQAQRPLYFSSAPRDLPLDVPERSVISAPALIERLTAVEPTPLFSDDVRDRRGRLERDLLTGNYLRN